MCTMQLYWGYQPEIRSIVFHMLVNKMDIRDFISSLTNGYNFSLKRVNIMALV